MNITHVVMFKFLKGASEVAAATIAEAGLEYEISPNARFEYELPPAKLEYEAHEG